MGLKKTIKMKVLSLVLAVALVNIGALPGYAVAPDPLVCTKGVATPPFLNTGVDPNLMLVIDNSASMYDLAFVENAAYCYDDSYDPTTNTYSGFFDETGWYQYDTANNQFVTVTDADAATACSTAALKKTVPVANGIDVDDICLDEDATTPSNTVFLARGRFLNWAIVSKMDIEKKILTGGKFDAANSVLQLESRGCLERRFSKQTAFDSGAKLTLAVRPADVAAGDYSSRIELFPATSSGYVHNSCQLAVEEMKKESPNLGQIGVYIDDCMGFDAANNTPEAASNSAFNHSVQDCWYINKFGLDQWELASVGSIARIKNDCENVYDAPLNPRDIGIDHSGYICSGDYLASVDAPLSDRGYVGRCWSVGEGAATEADIPRACTDEPESGANPRCSNELGSNDGIVYQCSGNYNSSQDTCNKDWVPIYDSTGGGAADYVGWLPDSTHVVFDQSIEQDSCVMQGLLDYCSFLNFPEVIDPSDQATGVGDATADLWNLPSILVDSGIKDQLAEPLLVMTGRLAQSEIPTGLIQKYADSIRMGAMTFNDDGAKSECDTSDPYVTYACDDPANRDGGAVLTEIAKSTAHTSDLISDINRVVADTWTPLGEAMYNAVGYYRQDDSIRLDASDFTITADPTTDPITNWCQANNVLLVTDGAPTADQAATMSNFINSTLGTTLGYTLEGATCPELHGSTYLKDLTKFANEDIWYDQTFPAGEERRNVSTHIVAAGSFRESGTDACLAENLLTDAASNGGTQLYQAENFNQLGVALEAAFSNIRAGASAGSAASVISSSRSGEGAIYQAIFWPSKPSSDLNSTVEVKWAGEVHSLFIDENGYMYEDTDDDRVLDDTDKRVIIYFDDTTLTSRACYTNPVGNTCSDSVDLDAVHYLWSANDWLAKISNSSFSLYDEDDQYQNRSSYISNARRRYIFTWNDLDNDVVVDSNEVIPFVSGNLASAAGSPTDWAGLTTSGARGPVANDFNVANDGNANTNINNIVDWIRGVEVTDSRSRTIKKKMAGLATDPEVVWRLGDVIHSTPTAVARPMENLHLLYRDQTYSDFVARWANRRHMIYFGANDGMMHAINAGFYKENSKKFCLTADCADEGNAPELGAEMWAYVPYNLMPHLKCLTDPNYVYAHKYYVDQPPRVFDARIFTAEGACSDSDKGPRHVDCIHPNGWGTILVGSMRFGGARINAVDLNGVAGETRTFQSSYFVMDITNPEAPPVLLGELVRKEGDAQLGFTTAVPTPVVMKDDAGAGSWYLMMGSGPSSNDGVNYPDGANTAALEGKSNQQPRVAVFPLQGLTTALPKIPFRIPDAAPTSSTPGRYVLDDATLGAGNGSANGFVSDMISVDYDLDFFYKSDAVYFGTVEHGSDTTMATASFADDWDGRLYRLVMDPNATGASTTPNVWELHLLLNAGQPITAAPAVATDLNRYWIYFGTGRFFDADIDKQDDAQQSFYGIKEPVDCTAADLPFTWAEIDKADLFDVSDLLVTESATANTTGNLANAVDNSGNAITSLGTLSNYIAGSPGSCSSDPVDGWYRDFSRVRERNVGQATVLGGLLTFTTYQPFSDPCMQDGQAYLFGLNYLTGTANNLSVFVNQGLDNTTVLESISIGRGLATTPNLHVGAGDDGPTAFVQTSTGEIVELPQTNLPNPFKTGRKSWLEKSCP
ncbi:pilus assembly protein [Malonomonas rubra]|uniref:pilus assembly protein n=1 Tax=Malonomonas rubra TaxID=57040 RepID=UPI0026EC4955|nr:PilC/PilY family type IV pilus protein [Malonomonas rubra]